jgi:hypothetical protein
MYELARDFAGPAATVLVAIFIGCLTWWYNRRQSAIAAEKLKIDLFERRYVIYSTLKELLECATIQPTKAINTDRIVHLAGIAREARFFFGDNIVRFVDEAIDAVYELLRKMLSNTIAMGDAANRDESITNAKIDLMSKYHNKMAEVFAKELRFKQF